MFIIFQSEVFACIGRNIIVFLAARASMLHALALIIYEGRDIISLFSHMLSPMNTDQLVDLSGKKIGAMMLTSVLLNLSICPFF